MMNLGSKVKLVSFNGDSLSPQDCDPAENYWRLIGAYGTIEELENSRGRVLVRFERNLSEMGLHCHNPSPNSLYILPSDLEVRS
ncbi:hypothetical protein FIU95_07770 [Microbulbifer sp. THAF38]|nr:hypothetical protein FIU95_07770 [Microbulbifer sp. THAF38]